MFNNRLTCDQWFVNNGLYTADFPNLKVLICVFFQMSPGGYPPTFEELYERVPETYIPQFWHF